MYAMLQKDELGVKEIPQYLAYTVQISKYSQSKDWTSVVKYDNEYRMNTNSLGDLQSIICQA
jgi:hypothetical protein